MDKRIALKIIIAELKTKGSVRLLVKGGSMSPTIRDGSTIEIRNPKVCLGGKRGEIRNKKEKASKAKTEKKEPVTRDPSPGDIVMYKAGNWFLIHRIKSIDWKTGLITVEGDSRDSVVHKIKKSAIIGIVKEKFKHKVMKVVAGVLKQRKQGKQEK